jgi:predicted  nucleic acid-binding Zn-ribbon protein
MKKISYIILIFSVIVVSCKPKEENNNLQTPDALQNEYSSLKRMKGDLTDDLYRGLVEKDSLLRNLEDEIIAFRSGSVETTRAFHDYLDKSDNYYGSVNRKRKEIKDSLLMKKMQMLITAHKKAQEDRTTEINAFLKTVSANDTLLNDHHAALKIVKTLAVMEKYQKEHLPNKNELKKLIEQQENILKQMNDLMSKP